MKNCTEKIVVISLIMLMYANDASAQDKFAKLRQEGFVFPGYPVYSGPLPNLTPQKKELTLNGQLRPWFHFYAGDLRLNWMTTHPKFVTICSCSCTFDFDANRKITNAKILKSSGSDSVDRDVLNAIKAVEPEKIQRIGDHTILVDFSNDPSDPMGPPSFKLRLLDDAPAVDDTADNSKSEGSNGIH